MLSRIISGGQTGVDRAALDAAIACGVRHGGWLPAGRRTEEGPLSQRYALEEMPTRSYPARTRKNVIEADATLIIYRGRLSGGSALTAEIALASHKPCFHIDLVQYDHGSATAAVQNWLLECAAEVLNVAGPRASSDKAIYEEVYRIVVAILTEEQTP